MNVGGNMSFMFWWKYVFLKICFGEIFSSISDILDILDIFYVLDVLDISFVLGDYYVLCYDCFLVSNFWHDSDVFFPCTHVSNPSYEGQVMNIMCFEIIIFYG
jgi:hypothetical protein